MPTFRAKLKAIDFDAKRWLKEFERRMTQQNRLAAGEWLRAAIQRIPVRSGMAAANLLPLSRFLAIRHAGELLDIHPVEKSRIAQGAALSDPPESMFKTNGRGHFVFEFDIGVLHYFLNEFGYVGPYANPINPAIQPPWDSLKAGEAAYLEYVESGAIEKAVPRVTEFTTLTSVNG